MCFNHCWCLNNKLNHLLFPVTEGTNPTITKEFQSFQLKNIRKENRVNLQTTYLRYDPLI